MVRASVLAVALLIGFTMSMHLKTETQSTALMFQTPDTILELRTALRDHANKLATLSFEAGPDMVKAADVLSKGICYFKGFCESNPAKTCLDILNQDGVAGRTELANGKYWIQPDIFVNNQARPYPNAVQFYCIMAEGEGWTRLFDDSYHDTVNQTFQAPVGDMLAKEYLVFTQSDLKAGKGRQGYLYNVDVTHLDHPDNLGRTPNQMMTAGWVGQDNYGQTVAGEKYPAYAKHYRFKYFGQPGYQYTDTLYILDDGDIGPKECRKQARGRGSCFFDDPEAKVPQTCFNPNGVLSFGCSNDQADFTQCGSCKYGGYGNKTEVIQDSMVRVMYVR